MDEIEGLLTPGLDAVVDPVLTLLLADGLHVVYGGVFAMGVVVLLLSLLLPRSRRLA
jgi:hypothetical protein